MVSSGITCRGSEAVGDVSLMEGTHCLKDGSPMTFGTTTFAPGRGGGVLPLEIVT